MKDRIKWEGAHHLYLQLGELNCEGRSSRGLVEDISKALRVLWLKNEQLLTFTSVKLC